MSIEKFKYPRFMVIASYPKCNFELNSILERIPNATNDHYTNLPYVFQATIDLEILECFPHLFKKLQWFEYRSEIEMPMYLKHSADKVNFTFHKILKWEMKYMFGFTDIEKREVCDLRAWAADYNYLPATEAEYLANINKKE